MALHHAKSLHDLHFIATGEELSPLPGDSCPHPLEYYVRRTQLRQQREHAYTTYYDQMRKEGKTLLTFSSPRQIGLFSYVAAKMEQGTEGCPIILCSANGGALHLWRDGREPPTPASSRPCSPCFKLRAPWLEEEEMTGIVEEDVTPASRLRKGFTELLKKMPEEALYAELEEWREEEARAHEHFAAVEAEIAGRLGR
jgi:hypothetical protein